MFKYNPNQLSRSERRHGGVGILPAIHESKAMYTPKPAAPTPYSVKDLMMFSMDPSKRAQSPTLAAESNRSLVAPAAPRAGGDGPRRAVPPLDFLGYNHAPTLERSGPVVPKPWKRIVGFVIAESEGSGTDRSSSDTLDCDSNGSCSDLGE